MTLNSSRWAAGSHIPFYVHLDDSSLVLNALLCGLREERIFSCCTAPLVLRAL